MQNARVGDTWRALPLGEETLLDDTLAIEAFDVPGKLPTHLVGLTRPSPEDNVGLRIVDRRTGAFVVYASAAADVAPVARAARGARALLLDGTFWTSDELVARGGRGRAEDMAHLPVGGPDGSLAALADLDVPRRVYTHVNNTNAMLVLGSPERARVEAAGWEIAHDGMEIAT